MIDSQKHADAKSANNRLSRKAHAALSLLDHHGDMYGLDLVRRSDGALKRGTVYVLLDRLEQAGLVTSREGTRVTEALPRRIYSITEAGREALTGEG